MKRVDALVKTASNCWSCASQYLVVERCLDRVIAVDEMTRSLVVAASAEEMRPNPAVRVGEGHRICELEVTEYLIPVQIAVSGQDGKGASLKQWASSCT